MSTLLLAPHGDDETLFAAYSCIRHQAHVIVCTQDADPAVRRERSLETASAVRILGCSYHEWPLLASDPNWDQAKTWLESWNSTELLPSVPERVFAPAVEEGGHEQHNIVGQLALDIFGPLVIPYLTYAPRGQRSRSEKQVIPTAQEIQLKLRALSCYQTQIANPATRPWFFDLLDLREWMA